MWPLIKVSRPILGLNQQPTEWVPVTFSAGVKRLEREAIVPPALKSCTGTLLQLKKLLFKFCTMEMKRLWPVSRYKS
jgi:hypothetical protein